MNQSERHPLAPALWWLAGAKLALHFVVNTLGGYGIFRDELYYLASTRYLDFGYVDHPPLSIWLLAFNTMMFGSSVFALRLLPALLGAAVVFLAGVLARELGGGRGAQTTSAASVMVAPIYLGFFGYYSMNSLDLLFWVAAFLCVLHILRTEEPRWWLALGLVLGLGLLNKMSMAWFGVGLLAALLTSPLRRWFRTPWPWCAAALAFLFVLPFVIWTLQHELAHLEFMRNAAGDKYASQNPLTFLTGLIVITNPLSLPLWLGGWWFLFRTRAYRPAGIIAGTVLVILLVNIHSKGEYFSGAMLLLFAAGAVQYERWTLRAPRLRPVYPALIVCSGIALLPMTLDVLPVETFLRYQSALGVNPPSTEGHELPALPQHYADRFGWKELADSVARVYHGLTPEEQATCAIYGRNYGEAAAIDVYGEPLGLPQAYSQHNSYFYWGLKRYRGERVWIIIRAREEELTQIFESVTLAAHTPSGWAMPYEQNGPIYVCRGLKVPFAPMWRDGKTFI